MKCNDIMEYASVGIRRKEIDIKRYYICNDTYVNTAELKKGRLPEMEFVPSISVITTDCKTDGNINVFGDMDVQLFFYGFQQNDNDMFIMGEGHYRMLKLDEELLVKTAKIFDISETHLLELLDHIDLINRKVEYFNDGCSPEFSCYSLSDDKAASKYHKRKDKLKSKSSFIGLSGVLIYYPDIDHFLNLDNFINAKKVISYENALI